MNWRLNRSSGLTCFVLHAGIAPKSRRHCGKCHKENCAADSVAPHSLMWSNWVEDRVASLLEVHVCTYFEPVGYFAIYFHVGTNVIEKVSGNSAFIVLIAKGHIIIDPIAGARYTGIVIMIDACAEGVFPPVGMFYRQHNYLIIIVFLLHQPQPSSIQTGVRFSVVW